MNRSAILPAAGIAVIPTLVLAAAITPLPDSFLMAPSTVVAFADGSPAHVFLSPDDKWRIEVALGEVDEDYRTALVRLEDKRFFSHFGVDLLAILRAVYSNLEARRVVSGGSTLTMQLARVREPRPRTFASKLVEAFRAIQLELRFSKNEILAAYLQYAPFGRNIEGVEAASLAYFGHRATALSQAEIATLLAVPQMPARRFPTATNRARLEIARNGIAMRLGTFDEDMKRTAVPDKLRAFPRLAPHAALWFRDKREPRDKMQLKTPLDRGVQLLAERTLEAHRGWAAVNGIHNGAVVVIDHEKSEIRGLVGNFDFWDERHGGQMIAFDTPRSPGSALKPFIYLLAIDRGIVLPDFLVLDTPVSYGSYAPKNYDGSYAGLVSLEDALSRSLNVPFVGLLQKVGLERFLGGLRLMGVEHLRPDPGFYGLSAAIGGIEITPLEMAYLYATLARDGEIMARGVDGAQSDPGPARADRAHDGIQMFSHGAAFLTQRALRKKDRPDFPSRYQMTGTPPEIHWKTGTSFGHRDAWAAGSGPKYTAVVWLGNLDNTPSKSLVGADAAGPILFDILEGLDPRRRKETEGSSDLKSIEVCAFSGRLPTPACGGKKRVLALVSNVPTERCPYHVALDIEVATGLALTPGCLEEREVRGVRKLREVRKETFLVWPASLRRWLDDEHRPLPDAPRFAPGCAIDNAKVGPSILSPPPNHVALLLPGLPLERQELPLSAEATPGGGTALSWFMDGEYLGTVKAEERVWWTPKRGAHEIVVTDEAGRMSRRRFAVVGHALTRGALVGER